MNLSMDTMHPKDLLVLFGSLGSTLTLPILFSSRINMLCDCSSTMTKDHFLVIFYGTEWPLCSAVPFKHSQTMNKT